MYELNFNDGSPIAIIYKEKKNRTVYLNEKNEKECKKNDKIEKCCKKCKFELCDGKCCGGCCQLEKCELNNDEKELMYNFSLKKMKCLDRSDKINLLAGNFDQLRQPIIRKLKEDLNERQGKEIIIHDGEVQCLPNKETRECIYVCGPSGSGKSTYIKNYAIEYLKLFPKNRVIVFSRLEKDESLDDLKSKLTRIILNDEIVEDPIDPSELHNSLCIFDDTDTIQDKYIKLAIQNLKNDLLETGRHADIYVAITSHLLTNYKESRTVLNESHYITFFPNSGSTQAIQYLLKTYFGFSKQEIQKILKLPSRWVTIKKTCPQIVFYNKGLYLVK